MVYLNVVNMIVVPNHKKNGDYYKNPSLTYFTNELWLQEKWSNKKLLLEIKCVNIMYPNVENMIVVPITKRMEIITSIQVSPISRMNNNDKENGGKKSFSRQTNASI